MITLLASLALLSGCASSVTPEQRAIYGTAIQRAGNAFAAGMYQSIQPQPPAIYVPPQIHHFGADGFGGYTQDY